MKFLSLEYIQKAFEWLMRAFDNSDAGPSQKKLNASKMINFVLLIQIICLAYKKFDVDVVDTFVWTDLSFAAVLLGIGAIQRTTEKKIDKIPDQPAPENPQVR